MNHVLIGLFALLCLGILVAGLRRREGVYEYPFLAGAIAIAFLLPQLPGLADNMFLPADGFAKTLIFTIFCIAVIPIGWRSAARPLIAAPIPLSESRLFIASAILSAAGAGFYVAVGRLPPETMVSTTISGVPVVLLFFSKMLVFGFAIAALCMVRRPSWPWLAIVLGDSILYLDRIVVTGKRGEALEYVLIVAMSFWFLRGLVLPRALVVAGLFFGVLGMTSTEDYRAITRRGETPTLETLSQIDVSANFETLLSSGGAEFQNAIMRIDLVSSSQGFDYGLFHWNELVMAFVPAQLVGETTKRSLLIETPEAIDRFYLPSTGTTQTGFADAFGSFGYLGFLKFFAIAWLMRRLHRGASLGDASSQIIYMLSVVPAMNVLSHHTNWIVTAWVQMAIFLGPALLFARIAPRRLLAPVAAS
ncbi:hypothetical protein ACFQI3_14805 [Hansschlegelia quercus]|uniref:Oligosaccharide repeat unit polymerase n=1 Tax=Hansschlegelia quercus TaxID=2528245 RepID=A0A4Q9GBJ4_9HYPH|nr:hypothetical protein [Hansschlegelia quercus]TBN47299.1 hypothetical protein EYR15_16290 [Hansschlegelia quercus]